ncbi:MAG: L-seryl-tRNA(Sec) selenium transferase [Verrucomicrobiales bacterium]
MSRRADAPTPAPSPRRIPQVDRVLQALADAPVPRPLVAKAVRAELARLRESGGEVPEFDALAAGIRADLERMARRRIMPVINATGVIIHTNLGRSPLSPRAADAAREVAASYCNLEIDLNTGKRGPRAGFLEACLAELCQAEAATVVNNCAAALVLILRHFALGKEVIISRGELVEIGGGFRIPEIMAASGARLREVGATNKTHLDDYRRAIGPDTGMILKVHKSNFYIEGFTAEAPPQDLATRAREHGSPFVSCLGSGGRRRPGARRSSTKPLPGEVLARGVCRLLQRRQIVGQSRRLQDHRGQSEATLPG